MTEQAGSRQANVDGTAPDIVRAVWSAVLGEASLDSDVGFFDLGATSMDVVAAVGRLRDRWPGLRVLDVFLHPTVNSLAEFLDGSPARDA
jgi:hypothetical protein